MPSIDPPFTNRQSTLDLDPRWFAPTPRRLLARPIFTHQLISPEIPYTRAPHHGSTSRQGRPPTADSTYHGRQIDVRIDPAMPPCVNIRRCTADITKIHYRISFNHHSTNRPTSDTRKTVSIPGLPTSTGLRSTTGLEHRLAGSPHAHHNSSTSWLYARLRPVPTTCRSTSVTGSTSRPVQVRVRAAVVLAARHTNDHHHHLIPIGKIDKR